MERIRIKINNKMKVYNKQFTQEHLDNCVTLKNQSSTQFNLTPANNICIIIEKLKDTTHLEGDYVECGTFKGNTLIPAALSSDNGRMLFGIDTFEGFPFTEYHLKDLPSYFEVLHSEGKISEDHYQKAKLRTKDFTDLSHLENEYFLNVDEVFSNCEQFPNIRLLKGSFDEITPKFEGKISVLHLDGDLYQSYLACLVNLYDNIIEGGYIIFDEYYSHKYPGARVAVDEFFEDKTDQGHFEMYITEEGHERWCFKKTKI